jgi:hypothetical protein
MRVSEIEGTHFYIKCPYSPLMFLKLRTGMEFMKKLQRQPLEKRITYFAALDFNEFKNMITLSSEAV